MTKLDHCFARLLTRLGAGRRHLRPLGPSAGGRTQVGSRNLINFSSNDYLGLARHPALAARASEWAERWGTGAGASRLVTGNLDLFAAIEEKIARAKGTEAALVLGSGFLLNGTVLAALFERDAVGSEPLVFSDRLNHASIHHGCRAAGVRQIRYRHNDVNHLEHLLGRHAGDEAARFIITESVFGMDGDRADLARLVELSDRHGAFLYVDEAHATGVLGPRGFGLSSAFPGRVDLVMGTFSKALGGYGAYLACSKTLRDYLVNKCTGLIYSTALPPPVLGAIDAALDLVPGLEDERRALHGNADRLRDALKAAGFDCGASTTQIVPVILGADEAVLAASRALEEEGMLTIAIRPPTVPRGTSRIRFALSAQHSAVDIDRLAAALPRLVSPRRDVA
ncbi:MAG: 8-amino-7-oxononanoate synthase [Proteobacteria bacterium]|nr:8-amino-7-oxononanoate synthase [Pseudomonadota bacterium]